MEQKSKDPLHGVTLQAIVEKLVYYYGFDETECKLLCISNIFDIKKN